ncbi:thermonuclease family protein [bacterium]|nr:thermonuclease family protein [bacterium]
MRQIQTGLGLAVGVGLLIIASIRYVQRQQAMIDYNESSPARPVLHKQQQQSETWQVVRVSDGDTLVVREGMQEEKIRFCGIDAPEKDQPLGDAAKVLINQLIEQANGQVVITPVERDRYGRIIAEVFTVSNDGEKLLQQELLTAGLAYVYPQYIDGCPNAQPMKLAEAIAQDEKVGVWSGDYQKPWDYRREH